MILKDGTKLFVRFERKERGKPAFVFLHGDGQNHTIWASFSEYFLSKGHGVLCYDLPGHGLSQPYKGGKYSFPRFAETLKQVLERYKVGRPIIVGNSTGGMIALQYAIQEPDNVSGVVAVSSCDESPSKHKRGIPSMIRNFVKDSERLFQGQKAFDYSKPVLNEEDILLAAMKNTSPEAVKGNLEAMMKFSIRSKLGRIKSPVLLIGGEKDVFVNGEWAKRTQREIPNSRLVTVKGFGHHLLIQAPKKVLKIIKENYSFFVQR